MENKIKISKRKKVYIVEDEIELAENIREILIHSNYDVIGIEPNGEKAIAEIEKKRPDIILIDIKLSGNLNGIDVCKQINTNLNYIIIFLTANSEISTLEEVGNTRYDSFLLKPINKNVLISTIYLNLLKREKSKIKQKFEIRDKGLIIPIEEKDILLLKADGLYTKIITRDKEYIIREIMKNVSNKLTKNYFIRVHKSYIINVNYIKSYNSKEVNIENMSIPIRRGFFKELAKSITNQI